MYIIYEALKWIIQNINVTLYVHWLRASSFTLSGRNWHDVIDQPVYFWCRCKVAQPQTEYICASPYTTTDVLVVWYTHSYSVFFIIHSSQTVPFVVDSHLQFVPSARENRCHQNKQELKIKNICFKSTRPYNCLE